MLRDSYRQAKYLLAPIEEDNTTMKTVKATQSITTRLRRYKRQWPIALEAVSRLTVLVTAATALIRVVIILLRIVNGN
jgi:hypothetical protein